MIEQLLLSESFVGRNVGASEMNCGDSARQSTTVDPIRRMNQERILGKPGR